jgi:hypothetical protein
MDVNELFELINTPFVQRALAGGILLGILGGLIGSFVILRRAGIVWQFDRAFPVIRGSLGGHAGGLTHLVFDAVCGGLWADHHLL